MKLVPWRTDQRPGALVSLEDLQQEMNRLFESPWSGINFYDEGWRPAMDITETPEAVVIHTELPGLRKEDIEVTVQDGTLTIKGEKKQESKVGEEHRMRTERFYGSFHRTLSLPSHVDASQIKGTYTNGVLELSLPKKEEAKPRSVKIEVK